MEDYRVVVGLIEEGSLEIKWKSTTLPAVSMEDAIEQAKAVLPVEEAVFSSAWKLAEEDPTEVQRIKDSLQATMYKLGAH